MKFLYTILLVFLFQFGFSQTFPITQSIGNKNTVVQTAGALKSFTGFIFIPFSDTSAANVPSFVSATPSIMILLADHSLWVRNETATMWVQISGGSGGSISLAAVGSSPNANGATITGSVLNLQPASGSFPGVVTTTSQTFGGNKIFSGSSVVVSGQLKVGSVVLDASAALNIESTTQGFLPPRMSEAQKNAISAPSDGLLVFQTNNTQGLYQYYNTQWNLVGGAAVSATNGLQLIGSDVGLGGTLTQNTTIDGSGFTFLFSGVNTFFNKNDTGGDIEFVVTDDFSITSPDVILATAPTNSIDTTNNKILIRNVNTGEVGTTYWNVGGSGGSGDALQIEPYGMVYNDSNWSTADLANDFDASGSFTVTDSAGLIVLSGGPTAFTASLNVDVNQQQGFTDYYSNLEYWEIGMKVRVIQTGIIGLGMRGTQATGATNAIGQLNTSTGASSFIASGSSNLSIAIGDWIMIRVKREGSVAYMSVYNITTNSATITNTGAWEFTTNLPPRIGQFAIFEHSGKYYVDSLYVTSTSPKNSSLLLVGTSKTQGLNAQFPTRYSALLNNKYATVNAGSGSSVSSEWVDILNEMVALRPRQVIIENPCNDLRFGVNVDSTKARVYRIETAFRAIGTAVYYIDALYETNSSPAAWMAYIYSTKSIDSILRCYTPTSATGCLAADNIHPTVFGHSVIANTIINSYKIKHSINNEQSPGLFIWNQSTVGQPSSFWVDNTSAQRASVNYLNLGTATAITSAADIPLRVRTLSGANLQVLGSGSNTFIRFGNDAATGGVAGIIDYGTLILRTTAGSESINIASTGALTINEGGLAIDTRIETDNESNMFVLSGANNRIGIGIASASITARLHLMAGTATASTAPIKLTSGTLLTTIEAGAGEFNGNFYLSNTALNRLAVGGAIKDFIADSANTGTSEEFMYRYTTKASTMSADGDKLIAEYTITVADATADKVIKFYFAGTEIYTSGTLTGSEGDYYFKVEIIRTSSSTARATVIATTGATFGADAMTYTALTSLTFSNAYPISPSVTVSGVGGGAGDATFKMGNVQFIPASNN